MRKQANFIFIYVCVGEFVIYVCYVRRLKFSLSKSYTSSYTLSLTTTLNAVPQYSSHRKETGAMEIA